MADPRAFVAKPVQRQRPAMQDLSPEEFADQYGLPLDEAELADQGLTEDQWNAADPTPPSPRETKTWGEWIDRAVTSTLPPELLGAIGAAGGKGYEATKKRAEDEYRKWIRADDNRTLNERRRGYVLNMLRNATFDHADELVAGAGSLMGEDYDKTLAQARAEQEQYRNLEDDWSSSNILSGATGFAGGGGPFTGLFKTAQSGIRGLRALGGAQSAARAAEAAGTAVPRGVAGMVAAAPVTSLGRGIENTLALGLTGAAGGEVNSLGSGSGTMSERLAAAAPGMAQRMATNAALGATAGVAAPAIGAGVSRLGRLFESAESKAGRAISDQLLRAGRNVDDLRTGYEIDSATGKPVALADSAPDSVRAIGSASGRMPGPGQEGARGFLGLRQEGQTGRIADDLGRAQGGEPGSFIKTLDELNARRAELAKPLYEKAFRAEPLTSPRIVEVTNRPSGKAAIQKGLRMAQDEGIALDDLVVRDAKGNITGYTTKALHYAKMAMDDMISTARRAGDNQAARQYQILKNDLLEEMDRLNPDYGRARKAFAGESAHSNALEMGRDAYRAHPDQIAKEMEKMTPGEREFYRRGYLQKVAEEVDRSPDAANAARRIFGRKDMRDRLMQVLGAEKFAELEQRLAVEGRMFRSYADVYGNSATAERLAAQKELDTSLNAMNLDFGSAIMHAVRFGDITPLMSKFGVNGIANLLQGLNQKARGEIVRMLYSSDPEEVRRALNIIAKQYQKSTAYQQQMERVAATASAQQDARNNIGRGTAAAAGGAGAAVMAP